MSFNTKQIKDVNLLTKLKKKVQQMLTSQAIAAHKIGLTPNKVSLIGFILAVASAGAYALAPSYYVASSFSNSFAFSVRILRHA